MKITLPITFINIGMISLSLSTTVFAKSTSAVIQKHEASLSSMEKQRSQPEFEITNEAEYADFVKKREQLNQSGSVKSAVTQTSTYSAASSSARNKNSSRTKNP